MDIESESLQFDHGSISFQFGVTFMMFIDIFKNFLYPSCEGFSVTDEKNKQLFIAKCNYEKVRAKNKIKNCLDGDTRRLFTLIKNHSRMSQKS